MKSFLVDLDLPYPLGCSRVIDSNMLTVCMHIMHKTWTRYAFFLLLISVKDNTSSDNTIQMQNQQEYGIKMHPLDCHCQIKVNLITVVIDHMTQFPVDANKTRKHITSTKKGLSL